MAPRLADELIRRLAETGVERIYGVVGDSLNPVTDALRVKTKLNGFTCGTKKLARLQPAPRLN
jgi:thiamine pyrophosphate-dependent acetolactate synthase large subunit-like protein